MRETIITAMARALFVQWWANGCSCGSEDHESCRTGENPDSDPNVEHRENGARPGEDLMDVAPETTDDARKTAEVLTASIEKLNGADIESLYTKAANAEGDHLTDPTPEDFGHYIAMQAVGHGVGWNDDHPNAGIKIPDISFDGMFLPEFTKADERFIRTI